MKHCLEHGLYEGDDCPHCERDGCNRPEHDREESSGAARGYAAHVEGNSPIDRATQAALDKMAALLHAKELIRTGNAAVDKTGRVVDRRAHPDAVPIPPHTVRVSDSPEETSTNK